MNITVDLNTQMMHLMRGESIANDRRHVLIACMMKSGSTFLASILAALPGFTLESLVPGWERREQELDLAQLMLCHPVDYVAQHHVRYSLSTAVLIEKFNIMPIVLVRNLFDVVISLRDHFRNESTDCSMGFVLEGMKAWEDDVLEDFIVTMIMPWYFNFFMSWQACPNKLLLNYDEHIKGDIESTLRTVSDYLGLGLNDTQVSAAILTASQGNTRKNKAITGRGMSLREESREKLIRMSEYYQGYDFSILGIKTS